MMGVRSGINTAPNVLHNSGAQTFNAIFDFHTEQTLEVPNRFLNTHLKQTRRLIKQNSPGRPWIPEEDVYLVERTFIFTKSKELHRSKKLKT
jgi:hypothetical protein